MNTPLDAPFSDPQRQRRAKTTKFLFKLEAFLWVSRLVGAFFILESWQGGTELVILSAALLGLLYVSVPHWLMGSQTRWQMLGSYAVGISLAAALWMRMAIFADWPGGYELAFIAFPLAFLTAIGFAIVLISKPSRWKEGTFYKHALIRLLLAIWFSVGLFLSVI